ncbi:TATA element modulatory factor-like [Dendronephthya gigantea]|uniref:TATA element modulatory factor-like n=1 Tax=Dendronephthya gigantea TaxID=151771 RepID=UPI00106A54A7|nr:TATA element modulatory factor-like [Dendronephthya gigantea]
MNWLDSSSFSGLLSQAQKSIDKVLDIPGEDDGKSKKGDQSLDTGVSQSSKEQKNKSSEPKSSGSWLSGADSFWGSLTQNVTSSEGKGGKDNDPNSINEVETKNKSTSEKVNDSPQKESKLSGSKSMNLKRNGKKRASRKKGETSENQLKAGPAVERMPEIDAEAKIEALNGLKGNNHHQESDVDLTEAKVDCISEISVDKKVIESSDGDVLMSKADDVSDSNEMTDSQSVKIREDRTRDSEMVFKKSEDISMKEGEFGKDEDFGGKDEAVDQVEITDKIEQTKQDETRFKKVQLENDEKGKEDEGFDDSILQSNDVGNLQTFEAYDRGDLGVNEIANYGEEFTKEQEIIVTESSQQFEMFSEPVAASTPQKKERPSSPDEKLPCVNTESNKGLTNIDDLMKKDELPEKILDVQREEESKTGQDLEVDSERTKVKEGEELLDSNKQIGELTSTQEHDRLLQIIEVRESKLVELSKENLHLQETNTILRSQIEQLDEVHKAEDAEMEEMKTEFTKRIGESEAKLQAAAKERDLFKKQLEETQKCLSSDIERQLKEFQELLQQKDVQITQLMEEGEKLSKQILQRNNNIKKLRAKEKELNTSNENLSSRFEEAESEIERLKGILKERDEHKKEQDDAIKKLNAYTKKQEEVIGKQKVELEESAAKLPSLQTALDNAYKEITELHIVNAAKSSEVQEAALSVEMTAKEELRIALEKLKKESQRECDALAMEVTDLQTQLHRNEQQAARREDNLRQEIADIQMRLQEAETRNQELTQSVSIATRPLLRQIENLQHSYGSQQISWEKLEKNLTERLADVQSQLATAQEKERASTERSIELSSKVASLESQVGNYRQEKSRIEAEFELEKGKIEALEDFKSRESGKVEAIKNLHSKQLETMMVEKSLLEQQLAVERTKYESEQKKMTKLEEQLRERSQKNDDNGSPENEDPGQKTTLERRRSRNSSSSSVFSLSDTMTRNLPSGGTAVLEELRATIRHKEGELVSMQSAISTLESSRESLTEELTTLMNSNENLSKENQQLRNIGKSFQELQTKYNALLQMYGEKQEETDELKLDLQDIKNMYKAQIQELLSGR